MKILKLVFVAFVFLTLQSFSTTGPIVEEISNNSELTEISSNYGYNTVKTYNKGCDPVGVEFYDCYGNFLCDGWVNAYSYYTFNGMPNGTTNVRVYKKGRCIKNKNFKMYDGDRAKVYVR